VRLIVLHTAQGPDNFADLGAYFADPASGVSSHVGIDDTPNTVGEYVQRDGKAWTASDANPVAVQAELCAFAEWDSAEWNRHPHLLANTAAWIAEEAAAFAIPIVKLSPAQAQSDGRGVCQHADLAEWGGGHWDCGPGFPIDAVLALAAGVTQPSLEEADMIIVRKSTGEASVFNGATKQRIADPASLAAYTAAGLALADITDRDYDAIPNG
jgi:hypothetical protein